MGGCVYRKVTLLIMAISVVTLAVSTVVMAAPKEKRTMCSPDGNTIEIPHNAKGPKGATEGVCPEAPPPDPVPDPVNAEAERACRDVYQGTFIPPNQCDWYSTNS